MEPLDLGQDLTELVHGAAANVSSAPMIDDLPAGAGEPAPRFTSLDDEPDAPAPGAASTVDGKERFVFVPVDTPVWPGTADGRR